MKKIVIWSVCAISIIFVGSLSACAGSLNPVPIPKELIKVEIPYGITPIDLRGTGKAEDRVIASMEPDGGRLMGYYRFIFLTKTLNAPLNQKFHFVGMPEHESLRAISIPFVEETACVGFYTVFARAANNPKAFFMITAARHGTADEADPVASFEINLYQLSSENSSGVRITAADIKDSDDIYYEFLPVRKIKVSRHEACTDKEVEKFAQEELKVKLGGKTFETLHWVH